VTSLRGRMPEAISILRSRLNKKRVWNSANQRNVYTDCFASFLGAGEAMTALIHGAAGEAVCGARCKLAVLRRGGGVATSHRSLSTACLHPSRI
jgi:hypothetical protein